MTQFQREIAIVSVLLVFSFASFYYAETVHTVSSIGKRGIEGGVNVETKDKPCSGFADYISI